MQSPQLGTFINKSAAVRIMATKGFVSPTVIKLWKLNHRQIGVRYSVGGFGFTTILNRSAFLADAQELRNVGAQSVKIKAWGAGSYPAHYTASGDRGISYTVRMLPTLQDCRCNDYDDQRKNGNGFGKPVCKHMIAAAQYLGFVSFKDWYVQRLDEFAIAA